MSEFKPLLADEVDLDNVDYDNTWVSAKYDGIRAFVRDGVVLSRKLKPIPNQHVQNLFKQYEYLDGEMIVGEPNAKSVYQDTYSGVMSKAGEPDVRFFAFDHIQDPNEEYHARYAKVQTAALNQPLIQVVQQHGIQNAMDLLEIEQWYLDKGYEGLMLRAIRGTNSRYKFGRSTTKQGTLLKLKRFTDAEAQVIGFQEEMFNGNEATKDELGNTKRSSHAENKVGKGSLGALLCITHGGVMFNVGTGFTAAQRKEFWDKQDSLLGLIVKYKSFAIGVVDAPRFPVFLGWRDPIDM